MIDRGCHNLLGVSIHAVDYDRAVEVILQAARQQHPLSVSALAVHGVMCGVRDSHHRYRLNQLDMVVPDGHPVRWAVNWLHGTRLRDRVYGPELMQRVCQAAADNEHSVFLFGGTTAMLDSLQQRLRSGIPHLAIAGARASRFRTINSLEREDLVAEIRDSGAAITLVGLGCPRQEVFAYEFRHRLNMPVLSVGAAFAFHAGWLPQAPQWMQRRGLEWAFRLGCEPRRLWARYCLLNPWYVSLVMVQKLGWRHFSTGDALPPTQEIGYG